MKKIIILGAVLASLILTGMWYYSDEKVITRRSNSLLECFEKQEGEGLLSNITSDSAMRDLLDKRVELDFKQDDIPNMDNGISYDREKLSTSYIYLMQSAKMMTLTDKNIEVLSIENDTAQVQATFHGNIVHKRYSLNSDLILDLNFKKTDEGWRINAMSIR